MDNFGWSIALVPGTPLIIGDTPDAHIQLQGAYGRAARIALQMDKSMMYSILSKYSGDYDTCVNDKIIQKSAKINNHDFISIGDFMAYYNRGKIYFDYGVIKTNGVDVRPESMSIQTTYPVFIRNTRIQVKMDETPIDILEPGTVPKKPELNLITTLFPPVFMMAMMMLLKGTMSGSSSSFMMFSVCSMGVGVLTSIFGIVNREKQYKKTCIERQDTYKLYIEKKRKEIENIRREELDCLNDQYYSTVQDMYLQDIDYLLPLFRDGIAVGMTFVVANLQTSGIGQRYLSNFEGRITLFCNDSSEYSMMLNGVRLSIPNTPGRCMVQLDKEVLEAQLFISFEGEKEYERVQKIKSFVDEQNDKYINQKAKVIPEIPKELTLTYIQSQFTESISDDKVIIGLDYTSILPVAVELKSGDVLSLTGKNQTDRETFAKYFMDTIVQKASGNTELYVLDDATKKMGECEFNPNTAMYLTSYHDVPPMIEEINQRIEQRYEMYSAGMFDELEMEPWIILVIDSADIMLNMSGDNKIMKYMKEWLGKYKNMKIFVFMPDIENNSISFNSPEMLKIVKDNRHYMVFDDVCNIKICDISVSASKKYSKPIETGDAYYIKDNELVKIKVVRQS